MVLRLWREAARRRQARRALQRQLDYQEGLALRQRDGGEANPIGRHKKKAAQELLSHLELAERPRMLEVGGGGKGLLFYLPDGGLQVGVDPLALDYRSLFPAGAGGRLSCAAFGEHLPFRDEAFDLVICDNVVDHAEGPATIVSELIRVLKPEGGLYFTVNVHHPIYHYAASAHKLWNAMGVRIEIGPFADHTVHLTIDQVRRMFARLPLRVRLAYDGIDESRQKARKQPPRHPGDVLKRLFFKNARYVMIATKQGAS
jgi:SAM-dependent methyltransferase